MKKGFMLFTLLAAFSGFAQADDAAIQQTLAKMGIKSSDIQPAPVAGMKTVLTNSGVLYITDDGKHIIQGPMYMSVMNAFGKADDTLSVAAKSIAEIITIRGKINQIGRAHV